MKSKLLFFTFLYLLSVNTASAQMEKAELYFKDGTVLQGKAKLKKNATIKFKDIETKKKRIIDMNLLDRAVIRNAGLWGTIYVLVHVENKSKPIVLERVVEGKATLYKKSRVYVMESAAIGRGAGPMYETVHNLDKFYVIKEGEETATHLTSNGLLSKNFKNAVETYFKDCPELIQKVEIKDFKKRDILEIVRFYNKNCGK